MGFDTGAVAFRLFYLPCPADSSLLDKFAAHAAPPITDLKTDPITGWVTGQHLLDREITEDKCLFGPYLYTQLMKAEKKIPESLLRAYIKIEEEVEKKARGATFLPRKVRSEIKERLVAHFLPQMPPTLTGIPSVTDLRTEMIVSGALSDKQVDAFFPAYREIIGEIPILLTPDTAAMKRKRINPVDLDPILFTPDETVELPHESTLGMDFLTWLWFYWETGTGVFKHNDYEHGLMLEGPLTFFRDGEGAHEALLRNGSPLNSQEAGIALLRGKKLKKVKLTLTRGDWIVTANVDSDFAFRAVKLPKTENDDASGIFQERMAFLEMFWTTFLALYDRFLDMRTNASDWRATHAAMGEWIARRAEKK